MSDHVVICECFARDGLQNEPAFVPTDQKLKALSAFLDASFTRIEATSYSSPRWVPAFADASDVVRRLEHRPGVFYKATCPNVRAVERAIADGAANGGVEEISLLVSASESHSRKNLRRSRAEQWKIIEAMAALARGRFRLVGVVSMALGCPFEGTIDPGRVADDAQHFAALGAELVTVGDTTGLGTPRAVKALFARLLRDVRGACPVAHFHDSRGSGIANCMAALEAGCTFFDSAIGGVGGHPDRIEYGTGRTGNVATEDLVNLLESSGVVTGLDLDKIMNASALCERILGRELDSAVARAGWGFIEREDAPHADGR